MKTAIEGIPCTVTMLDGSSRAGELRVDHSASSYGIPVIVLWDSIHDETGEAYGQTDVISYIPDWKHVRRELFLTQSKLAERLKVSTRTVQGWESGDHQPSFGMLAPLFRTARGG